jgi:hypothetical protein
MRILIFAAFFIVTSDIAVAQQYGRPVEREAGERCPNRSTGSDGWCVPDRGTTVVRSHGHNCPEGFVTEGQFCTRD